MSGNVRRGQKQSCETLSLQKGCCSGSCFCDAQLCSMRTFSLGFSPRSTCSQLLLRRHMTDSADEVIRGGLCTVVGTRKPTIRCQTRPYRVTCSRGLLVHVGHPAASSAPRPPGLNRESCQSSLKMELGSSLACLFTLPLMGCWPLSLVWPLHNLSDSTFSPSPVFAKQAVRGTFAKRTCVLLPLRWLQPQGARPSLWLTGGTWVSLPAPFPFGLRAFALSVRPVWTSPPRWPVPTDPSRLCEQRFLREVFPESLVPVLSLCYSVSHSFILSLCSGCCKLSFFLFVFTSGVLKGLFLTQQTSLSG